MAKPLYCTFCSKSQHEVRTPVVGPASVSTRDECVHVCNDVIAKRPVAAQSMRSIQCRPSACSSG